MVFATERRIQLQRRLDSDRVRDVYSSLWSVSCGEEEVSTTCADETSEACVAHKPLFAQGHPLDGSATEWAE